MLPALLGKPFFSRSAKVPLPVSLDVETPARLAAELRAAVECTYVHLAASASTGIRVARADFTAEQLAENVAAVVEALVARKVPAGWRGVRSFHIKSPDSAALPIWMTQELYADDDVLDPVAEERKALVDAEKKEKRAARRLVKRAKRSAFVKNRAAEARKEAPRVEVEVAAVAVSAATGSATALGKSQERLVEREVEAKKRRRALGDVVDAGLDVTVKEAKKFKSKATA